MDGRRLSVRSVLLVVAGVLIDELVIAPVAAHLNATFSHLWRNRINGKVVDAGATNQLGDEVDWRRFKTVPADFANGTGNRSGGGVVVPVWR
jgi:hypothetical protein